MGYKHAILRKKSQNCEIKSRSCLFIYFLFSGVNRLSYIEFNTINLFSRKYLLFLLMFMIIIELIILFYLFIYLLYFNYVFYLLIDIIIIVNIIF